MALRDQPYLPLYIQDFMTDEKLAECSAESTGVYIRLMCIMHKSDEYGKILLKQKDKQTDKQIENFALKIGKLMPYPDKVVLQSLTELLEEKVIKIEGDYLLQGRMVHDNDLSLKRSSAGKIGGDVTGKHLLKQKPKQKPKLAKAKKQANTEYESEDESAIVDVIIKSENFIKFESWITKVAPNVSKMTEPFTEEQYYKLVEKFTSKEISSTIEAMHNKIDLLKKYKSAYLTCKNWIELNNKKYPKNDTGNNTPNPYEQLSAALRGNPSTTGLD